MERFGDVFNESNGRNALDSRRVGATTNGELRSVVERIAKRIFGRAAERERSKRDADFQRRRSPNDRRRDFGTSEYAVDAVDSAVAVLIASEQKEKPSNGRAKRRELRKAERTPTFK